VGSAGDRRRDTVVPDGVGTAAWKWPSASATAVTTEAVSVFDPGCPAEITTVAPGAVVPLTTVWAPVTAAPWDGDVIDRGTAAVGVIARAEEPLTAVEDILAMGMPADACAGPAVRQAWRRALVEAGA
jgi:hypothetical protein